VLKWIAVVTMFIDHIGAAILEPYIGGFPGRFLQGSEMSLYNLDMVLRSIGRLAFPLFVFLLVEGFFYTRSRLKHLIRLAVFCAVSEIAFDVAFFLPLDEIKSGRLLEWSGQNVFFTLTIGFLAIMVIDRIREKWHPSIPATATVILKLAAAAAITVGAMLLAKYLKTDYSNFGVLAIVLVYGVRLLRQKDLEIVAVVAPLALLNSLEAVAIVDWIFVHFYNGRKGRNIGKWFFYIFYPGHLLLLSLIRIVCFGI